MKRANVRLGLIGCGKIGGVHAAAAHQSTWGKMVAFCDADGQRAEALAQRYDGRAFDDVGQMLNFGVDAVIVATPHPLHAAAAVPALECGVHVLVEKPLAASLADCDLMLAAAEAHGATLGVVSQRRFYEPIQRMRRAVDAGGLGQPVLGLVLMYSWRDAAYYESDPWRGRWSTEGGGVLVNQSPHHLDLLLWFMGPVAEVTGLWGNLNHPTIEVEDTAVAALRFRSGGLGSILVSLSQQPGIYSKIHIHGANGGSVGSETDTGPTFIAGQGGVNEPPLNDLWTLAGQADQLAAFQEHDRAAFRQHDATTYYHRLQIDEFCQAVQTGRQPLSTGQDGRAVVELFTAIYQSHRERRTLALPLVHSASSED